MSALRHTVGGGRWPIAERSASDGGARSPSCRAEATRRRMPAAPANHRTQPIPPRRQSLNRTFGLRPHPELVMLHASQTLRHARGAHSPSPSHGAASGATRPTARAKPHSIVPNPGESCLIVLNRETSNRASSPPSKARCSHQAAPGLGLLCLRRLHLCGGHGRRPPLRLETCRPTLFLAEADVARPHPFRQSLVHGVYPSTPARNKRSVVHGPWS